MERETGRSKGFGFVEMSTDEEAQKAISMFDGKDFGGRNLVVNEAKPMTDRPRRDARPQRSGGGSNYGSYRNSY
jgi:RNA recognition motif-containing protein